MIALLGAYSCVSFGQINNTEGNSLEPSEALDKKKNRRKRKKIKSSLSIEKLVQKGSSQITVVEINSSKNEEPPGKVPVKGIRVKLRIQNNHNVDMWYLMPGINGQGFPDTSYFASDESNQVLRAYRYKDATKMLIEVEFGANLKQGFRAIYVPAGGTVLCRNYDLGAYKKGGQIAFWAVTKLLVNAEIPLTSWLKSRLISSDGVRVQQANLLPKPYPLDATERYKKTKIVGIKASIHQKYDIAVDKLP